MQISGINGMNNISSIYTYGNSHFNQIQNNPVTPVTKVKSTQPVDGEQDKSKYAVVYGNDKTMQMHRMSHIIIQTIHMRFQRWKETV